MLREDVADALREEYERDGFVFPAYESYCFGNVPDTVRTLLDAGGRRPLPGDVFEGVRSDIERVVVILLDGTASTPGGATASTIPSSIGSPSEPPSRPSRRRIRRRLPRR